MKPIHELFLEIGLFILALILLVILWSYVEILTIIIISYTIFAFFKVWSKEDRIMFFVAAIIGSIAEIVAISFGAWQYTSPTVLGIPSWLPFIWGAIVIFMRRIVRTTMKMM